MYQSNSLLPQIQTVLDQNLSDSNFSIPEFCNSLNISRTHLHRKLTEQAGISTSHYIRSLRLDIAKGLLEKTQLNGYCFGEYTTC